ncbi:hypothetical protein F4818DRAFT_47839 [Hypoxylon cercidicola]|nr:hypothetical protein F4818DRAFT_47839 [Hypoxylon cercidicola]
MNSKDQRVHSSPLSNELLLHIFESNLPPSTLSQCTLCCKRWLPLASSVLYGRISLTTHTLSRWVESPSGSNDVMIKAFSLTIFHDGPITRQRTHRGWVMQALDDAETMDARRQLHRSLKKLPSRLANMVNLRYFSHSSIMVPTNLWIPKTYIASIIDHVPRACTFLDINVMDTYDIAIDPHDLTVTEHSEQTHLCISIRRLLPQLRDLQLRLPDICPAAFGCGFDPDRPSSVARGFKPAGAPCLEQCRIQVADCAPPSFSQKTRLCGSPIGPVPVLASHLRAFKSPKNAPKLRELWMINFKIAGVGPATTLFAVHRDVVANRRRVSPVITPFALGNDTNPVHEPAEVTRDLLYMA